MKKFFLSLAVAAIISAFLSPSVQVFAQSIFSTPGVQVASSDAVEAAGRPENLSPQPVPFFQNWSNTNLITTNHDWSNVPGIIGYRGDNLTAAAGTDPQTVLIDGSGQIDVTANQTDPATFQSGGVNEYEIANPTIALQGSGTADAPHIVISLNTSGTTGITAAYTLRDIDAASDDAVQAVALQYRIGASGDYTNLPAGFVADASTGPGQATLVTPVSVVLPAVCENQPLVQLRIITSNATGVDEWIGIDNISITGTGGGGNTLMASMNASPGTVVPPGNTLLTVTVTPGTDPPSTGITVVGDLSDIGGAASQPFFDNGTNGDVTAGDNVFSFLAVIPANASGGVRNVTAVASDAQARSANVSVNVTINAPPESENPLLLGNPSNATADVANENNYLMQKPQYSLSYNRSKNNPNWTAWRLDSTWIGTAERQDDYRPDTTLPAGWYRVTNGDYSGSNYDRGHMCPSGDRTRSVPDNSATFLMTNIIPQKSENNQGPWADLENYCRTLAQTGNEIYIFSGGTGNIGTIGDTANRIVVPAVTWKVVMVLPNGSNDLARVSRSTRAFGVIMSNQSISQGAPWRNFRVTVDAVEYLTGYNFFSNVPKNTQELIEKKRDRL